MRKLKLLLTILSCITVSIISIGTFCSYAEYITDTYEINNEEYITFINKMGGVMPCEDEFLKYMQNSVHVYYFNERSPLSLGDIESGKAFSAYTTAYFEILDEDGGRRFQRVCFDWNEITPPSEYEKDINEYINENFDVLNAFLKENKLKAEFVKSDTSDSESYCYSLGFDVESKLEDIVDVHLRLRDEFGINCILSVESNESCKVYYDETPVGDVDKDNEVTVRDCAYIASKVALSEADSLPMSADFNGDEKVNVRDAAAIANYLATK